MGFFFFFEARERKDGGTDSRSFQYLVSARNISFGCYGLGPQYFGAFFPTNLRTGLPGSRTRRPSQGTNKPQRLSIAIFNTFFLRVAIINTGSN